MVDEPESEVPESNKPTVSDEALEAPPTTEMGNPSVEAEATPEAQQLATEETAIEEPATDDPATLSQALAEAKEQGGQPTPSAPQRTCTTCGESCRLEANWCEACGADLDATPVAPKFPCVSCRAEAVEITDDGYCQVCGAKQPAPEDHVVADHGWFAVVSDRGRVHRTNEDAGAVRARSTGVALVVCDGVSSTDESQHAAQSASQTVANSLQAARFDTADQALVQAAADAQVEIVRVAPVGKGEPASCTMVAAIIDIDGNTAELRLGWLGDSRAYWVTADETVQLTRDHSWATEQIDLGQIDLAEIEADSRAHSITRWLGADSHDVTPEIVSRQLVLPGLLMLCSDGLWNYAETPPEMHTIVHAGPADETPLAKAERLVAFANEQGGRDNITVAIASLSAQTDTTNSTSTSDQE